MAAGVTDVPDELLKSTEAGSGTPPAVGLTCRDWLKDRFCPRPFERLETHADETVRFCPASWQPEPVGSLSDDPANVWNSDTARAIRRSVLEGDFSHCSEENCPHILNRSLPSRQDILSANAPAEAVRRYREILTTGNTRLDAPPREARLSHDLTCNISCPSCRTNPVALGQSGAERLDGLVNETYPRFLSRTAKVVVGEEGEPFASRHFLNFLKAYCLENEPRRTLHLRTSGLMLTEAVWNRLGLWDHVASVRVSVDAASPGTYRAIRRGGQFDRLLPNLDFLGHLRRNRMIDELRTDFLVQRGNYGEIPDFVRMSRRAGASRIRFGRLQDRGALGGDAMREHDVCNPGHREHERLLEVLKDPVLEGTDVDLTSITSCTHPPTGNR